MPVCVCVCARVWVCCIFLLLLCMCVCIVFSIACMHAQHIFVCVVCVRAFQSFCYCVCLFLFCVCVCVCVCVYVFACMYTRVCCVYFCGVRRQTAHICANTVWGVFVCGKGERGKRRDIIRHTFTHTLRGVKEGKQYFAPTTTFDFLLLVPFLPSLLPSDVCV